MSTYELYYWPSIPGRGEFIRLLFAESGVNYIDVGRQENGVKKIVAYMNGEVDGTRPFAPPFVRVDGKIISQVANVMLFLAKRFDLVEDELWEQANQLQLTIADFVGEIHDTHHPISTSLYYEEQKEAAIEAAKKFREFRMPKFLGFFEDVLKRNGGSFIVGTKLSYVDLSIFALIRGLEYAFPKATKRVSAAYPALFALKDSIAKRPNVVAYLSSDRAIPYNQDGIFRQYPELDD